VNSSSASSTSRLELSRAKVVVVMAVIQSVLDLLAENDDEEKDANGTTTCSQRGRPPTN
jgi:hypothetical protein